ncbi:N-terminal domain of Peptidase_S41 [Asanoa hainanensis]|uniref:N-terminal domain of Peptidase_S41 n=1 Tax=Asanoa hainanensis TaxID=560556 RepID=A0A239H8Q6_9ACTN|nr:S41 family peptidase [Asanoa hainanensis]SNS77525.1 N-terminal domain of Peptidase_S41 [Asanoa hainanensis]
MEIVSRIAELMSEHYVFPDVAAEVVGVLAAGSYPPDDLAAAVTRDLQSVNGDKHLRLIHHDDPLPAGHGDDETDIATMAAWADRTGGGVASVQRLDGGIAHLDLHPVLFPTVVSGDTIAAAMTLVASADALVLDLRRCLGGEPGMVAFVCGYLFGAEPVELSGLFERTTGRVAQSWTPPYVPGRRFGPDKPVAVLISDTTFSGGEQLAYDLQQTGRATVVGQRSRGGAHPRRAFRIDDHLELTVPVARSVSPITGGNWEGTGVVPDVETAPDETLPAALTLLRDR